MLLKNIILAGALALCALLLSSPSSFAQATRTWVSGVGDDVNPCSRTAPCKTFAGAISKTAAGGEINIIEPGAFGTVTITKAITIKADGFTAGILAAGTNGIIVNAPSNAKVVLEGLDLEGANGTASPGLNGVRMIGQGRLTIRHCSIRNFGQNGVSHEGTGNARVFIEDTYIAGNGGGISIQGAVSAVIQNTTLDLNTNFSIRVDGPASVVLSGSSLVGSDMGLSILNGGQVISYGNNLIRNGGVPTQTVPLQ